MKGGGAERGIWEVQGIQFPGRMKASTGLEEEDPNPRKATFG